MNNLFKTSILLLIISVIFQSCTSDESGENTISEELEISTDLSEKIIATASSLNDYNFFVSNATKTNCDLLSITSGYFNNPKGDYFSFIFSGTESLDMWLTQYNDAKLQAFNTTGVEFSDEDFFINFISNPTGFSGLSLRESMLIYFETCVIGFGDTSDFGILFTDISPNCDINTADVTLYIFDDTGSIDNFSTTSLFAVEDLLASYNFENNTDYGVENLKIISIPYITPNDEEIFLIETMDLVNYFNDCKFSRDASSNDCLNFVYPIEINRFSLQLEEVITTTIESDEDLKETFSSDVGEIGFVFPIKLLGADGNIVEVETNEALETTLHNSSTYCN